MHVFFHKITPVYIVSILCLIYLLIQFFKAGNDYNIFAYLIIFIIFIIIVFAIDRLLAFRVNHLKLIIFEIILLVGCVFGFVYSSGYTEINVETNKPYFFVIYKDGGLKKTDIPSKGLFKKSITIKSNDNILIDKDLEYKAQINPPNSWNFSFSSTKVDTIINNRKLTIAIFAHEIGELEAKELLLKNEIKKLSE